jgi:hypothetical protein
VLAILALAVYPQYLVESVEPAAKSATTAVNDDGSGPTAYAPANGEEDTP